MDLLSFSADLEAQADQLVSRTFITPTNYGSGMTAVFIQTTKSERNMTTALCFPHNVFHIAWIYDNGGFRG